MKCVSTNAEKPLTDHNQFLLETNSTPLRSDGYDALLLVDSSPAKICRANQTETPTFSSRFFCILNSVWLPGLTIYSSPTFRRGDLHKNASNASESSAAVIAVEADGGNEGDEEVSFGAITVAVVCNPCS